MATSGSDKVVLSLELASGRGLDPVKAGKCPLQASNVRRLQRTVHCTNIYIAGIAYGKKRCLIPGTELVEKTESSGVGGIGSTVRRHPDSSARPWKDHPCFVRKARKAHFNVTVKTGSELKKTLFTVEATEIMAMLDAEWSGKARN